MKDTLKPLVTFRVHIEDYTFARREEDDLEPLNLAEYNSHLNYAADKNHINKVSYGAHVVAVLLLNISSRKRHQAVTN